MSDITSIKEFCEERNIRKIDFLRIAHGVYEAFTSVESNIFSSLAQHDFMKMAMSEDVCFIDVLRPFMYVAIKIIDEYEVIGQVIKGEIND